MKARTIGRYRIGSRVVAYNRGIVLAIGPLVGGRMSRTGVLLVLDDKSRRKMPVDLDEVIGERTWKRQLKSIGIWRAAQAEYDRA